MDPVISVRGLAKRFGDVHALDGLDLEVGPGEVHGFLGPNGSGKSTTIRVLLGLLRADGGDVSVLGADPWHDAVSLHRHLAYVPGDVNLWPNLTGGEAIDLFGRLRGGLDDRRRQELMERFELDPTRKGRTYSKGNRQKVALIAALAADAQLLILDEPTSGLDPLMEAVFQQCIGEAARDGRTILLSSHILAEVESLCGVVTIIRAGRTVQSGTLRELRHLTRTTVTATTRKSPDGLGAAPGVHNLQPLDDQANGVTFDVDSDRVDSVMSTLADLGIASITAHPPTLEDLFLREYSDEFDSLGIERR
ncbi:ABC transporter ATP-binding protein [Prescottella agglutinans]|uniref:ABC transporter ATP-binding protein n=1 Tax=Prescottella agglutinans TaxID=1644129 RepID=UPI003D95DC58